MHTVQIDSHQSLALGPDGALLPTQPHEGWDRPAAEEMLTGRAAPDSLPLPVAPPSRHGKRVHRGASQGATTRSESALHKLGVEPSKPAQPELPTGQPEQVARHDHDHDHDNDHDDLTKPVAASEHRSIRRAPLDQVQINRADFRAAPVPANALPPKASVSRADF
jgi:hypothetical protein